MERTVQSIDSIKKDDCGREVREQCSRRVERERGVDVILKLCGEKRRERGKDEGIVRQNRNRRLGLSLARLSNELVC